MVALAPRHDVVAMHRIELALEVLAVMVQIEFYVGELGVVLEPSIISPTGLQWA